MNAGDILMMVGQQARMVETVATHKKARKLASLAVKHATAGLQAYNLKQDSANTHMNLAKNYLKDASIIHANTLDQQKLVAPAPVLQHAMLGEGEELHQQFADDINKGKNNGR